MAIACLYRSRSIVQATGGGISNVDVEPRCQIAVEVWHIRIGQIWAVVLEAGGMYISDNTRGRSIEQLHNA